MRTFAAQASPTSENSVDRTRNIGIIAHIDAGKTTTTERMLYFSGFTRRLGDVDDGSTVTDFLPAERARGITIQSAAITFEWPPESSIENSPAETVDLVRTKRYPLSTLTHSINLIDTPGHADFTFEVLRSLRILDGAICILDGVAGVEAQTEQVWRQASKYHIPRIVYVNKLDRDGAAFGRTVKEIASRLEGWPAVCQIPWFENGNGSFTGVGDVVNMTGILYKQGGDGKSFTSYNVEQLKKVDVGLAKELEKARVALVELLSEHDDSMVEKFLEADENHIAVRPVDIVACLRRCLLGRQDRLIPVFAGASFRNIGVQPLLDSVVNLLPNPQECPDPNISIGGVEGGLSDLLAGRMHLEARPSHHKRHGKNKASAPQAVTNSPGGELEGCALAFKVVSDARRGVLVYIRVYSGTIRRNTLLYNTNLSVSERAPRLLRMYASDSVEVQSIEAGQIGVVVGLKHARTGDTLISYAGNKASPPEPLNSLQLRPIDVPPPVFFASIEPKSLSEEKPLLDALTLLLREDPSLHVTVDEDSGQTLLSGMGELHLEIARDRLINDFKAKMTMGRIEISYRESLLAPSVAVTKIFDKDTAGRRGKAGCTAIAEPIEDSSSESHPQDAEVVYFSEERDGNRVTVIAPALYWDGTPCDPTVTPELPSHLSLEKILMSFLNGALSALVRGPKHAYPLHSTHITLVLEPDAHLFGTETTLSSLSSAARLAAQAALRSAASAAGTALLEPVMHVVISVDESSLGSVIHDLSSSRGGHVVSLDAESDNEVVAAVEEERPLIDVRKIYAPPDPFAPSTVDGDDGGVGNRPRTIIARVPLKEMIGYLKHLRSLTGGRGTFVMSVDRFERMSGQRGKAVLGG